MNAEARKVLLWDLDGTIINSFDIFVGGLQRVLPRHGFAVPTVEVIRRNFHGTMLESISGITGVTDTELLEKLEMEYLIEQDTAYEDIDTHLLPDALALMKQAHELGWTQIIVTTRGHAGRNRASPRHIVEHSQLKKYIDTVICGDDSEFRKPDKRVVDRIADVLQGAEVLVIGDQHVDADLANNLGTKAVLVCRDGVEPPHMETLGDWHSFVTIVRSLEEVKL